MSLSDYNNKLTLEYVLSEDAEGQYFDRKSSSIKLSQLAKTIIAFANADGGTVAIGIKDRLIEGINDQGNIKINDFIQCGIDQCKPAIKLKHEFVDVAKDNGNTDRILFLHVEPSIDRVHKNLSDEVYLRVGDENKRLDFDQRIILEYDKGERLFEDRVVSECRIEDLDLEVLNSYKTVLEYKGDNIIDLLYARGFAKKDKEQTLITVAGVLLFAKNPTQFLPNARVRFIRYEGTKPEVGTSMNIVKQESIESPLPKLIEKVKDVVQSQLRTFTALNPLTGKFVSVPEYPTFAWQEGIINAITHRSYSMQGEDIRVFMFDDRLEILSPGKFPNIVNKYNIREVRYSRNPRIARALTELGWVRELGEGVKRIFEEMKLFFLDEPIYEEPNYSVLLTLKNNIITRRQRRVERISTLISKEWNNLSNEEKRALEMAYGKDKLTTREFADSISRSANYSRNILNGLVDKGFLHKIASSKTDPNQYFELVDYNEE